MRFLLAIFVLLLFDWYAFQAFVSVSADWADGPRVALYITYWSFPLLVFGMLWSASISRQTGLRKENFAILRSLLTLAYLAKFIIILVLLVDDLRGLLLDAYYALVGTTPFEHSRSYLVAQIAIFTGTFPFFLMTYGMLRNRHRYKVFKETVVLEHLPAALNGLKIVQISDIHSGSFTKKEPLIFGIDLINKQQADLVFFTGDLVNTFAEEMRPFIEVFDKVKAKYGVFSITGNHDYGDYARWESLEAKQANFQTFIHTHQQLGWDLLLNENRILEVNGEKIAVIGVENYSASPRFSKYGDLSKAYAGTDGAAIKLLLSHDPSHWQGEVLKGYKDIDITFSGHTHGMQFGIEIPGWIKWSPIKYVYKQWAGLYQSDAQYLYVNRGFGFLGYPGRVGILPEITVMELKTGVSNE